MNLENKIEEELHKMSGEIFKNNRTYKMTPYDMAERLCRDYQNFTVENYRKASDYLKQEYYDKIKLVYKNLKTKKK